MTIRVTDSSSNSRERIAHAAELIEKSQQRRKVFEAIYRGKKAVKSVQEIADSTSLTRKQVLMAGRLLAANEVVEQTILDGDTAYKKDSFIAGRKAQILRLGANKKRLDEFPTSSNPSARPQTVFVRFSGPAARARQVHIDDIDSFAAVARVRKAPTEVEMSEDAFKCGIQSIIGEPGKFADWGGEKNDLFTTRAKVNGKRRATAFAFKGSGKKKRRLTPADFGKNGDQIQRLFTSPADLFIVQYWREIDPSVLEQMKMWAYSKSVMEQREILFGIIDGRDSARLVQAFPNHFQTEQ